MGGSCERIGGEVGVDGRSGVTITARRHGGRLEDGGYGGEKGRGDVGAVREPAVQLE